MAVPARPYDALYDGNTYTVSGARDHYRQQTVAGGFMVERAPNYPTMFSELPHFPATAYRFKNSDKVPGFVDRTFHNEQPSSYELTSKSQPGQVNGRHQYKYFRRPLLAAPDPVIIKQAPALPALPPVQYVEEPKSKTIGTQSDYRENEAQTTPWEPSYVIPEKPSLKQQALSAKHFCDGPELLKLRDLKFGDGLPPGLQEVRRIEKMREKRAFEASLPPLSDVDQLPLRQKMLEDWESKEWAEREAEILSVQDERLALLEQALLAREDEFDENTMRRVEDRKTAMLQNRSERFATIQANRIKTMRQLIEARKYVEKPRKLHKLTIVEKYANFGSSTYAPVQRDGRFPDTKPNGKTIETEGFQPATLQGLNELESYLPSKMLNPRISAPMKPVKLNYQQRQDVAVQRDLKAINDLLDTAKASKGRGVGDCWPAPLKDNVHVDKSMHKRSTFRNTDRPDTPVLAASVTAGREAAAVLLQRLLRGRAAQNLMYEGKTRCQALIQELSLEGRGSMSRPEDCDASDPLDNLIGLVVSGLSSALTEMNPVLRAEQLTSIFGPTMAPPPLEAWAAESREPREVNVAPKVGFDAAAVDAPAPRGATFQRVETVVYEKGAHDAVQQAVYARVNTLANTVVGAVAEEMAAAVAAAVAEAVAVRISESGEAAAVAEAAAEAARRISESGEAEAVAEAAAAGAGTSMGAYGSDAADVGTETAEADVGTETAEADVGTETAEADFGAVTAEVDVGTETAEADVGTETAEADVGTETAEADVGTETAEADVGTETAEAAGTEAEDGTQTEAMAEADGADVQHNGHGAMVDDAEQTLDEGLVDQAQPEASAQPEGEQQDESEQAQLAPAPPTGRPRSGSRPSSGAVRPGSGSAASRSQSFGKPELLERAPSQDPRDAEEEGPSADPPAAEEEGEVAAQSAEEQPETTAAADDMAPQPEDNEPGIPNEEDERLGGDADVTTAAAADAEASAAEWQADSQDAGAESSEQAAEPEPEPSADVMMGQMEQGEGIEPEPEAEPEQSGPVDQGDGDEMLGGEPSLGHALHAGANAGAEAYAGIQEGADGSDDDDPDPEGEASFGQEE